MGDKTDLWIRVKAAAALSCRGCCECSCAALLQEHPQPQRPRQGQHSPAGSTAQHISKVPQTDKAQSLLVLSLSLGLRALCREGCGLALAAHLEKRLFSGMAHGSSS